MSGYWRTAGPERANPVTIYAVSTWATRLDLPTFDVEQLHRTHELLSMVWTPSAISAEFGIPVRRRKEASGEGGVVAARLGDLVVVL